MRRLAHYLKLSISEIEEKLPGALSLNKAHESSYFGKEWTLRTKNMVETGVKHDTYVLPSFKFWGYDPYEYKLTNDCESLEWIKQMRAAKGPLPGDDDPKLKLNENSEAHGEGVSNEKQTLNDDEDSEEEEEYSEFNSTRLRV